MPFASELKNSIPTLRVVSRELSGAAIRRVRRSLRPARKLRVGVDIRPFYEPLTGVGWYLYELLVELAKRDEVELVGFGDARMTDDGPHLHVSLPPAMRLAVFDLRRESGSRFSRAVTAAGYLPLIDLESCDLIWGANYFLPRLMSAVARRRIITVHDLTYRRHPQLLQQETLDNLNHHMLREVARADAVICVSEATRRDLLAFYPVDPSKVHAILSGANFPIDRTEIRPRDGYILFVSTIEPRKDLSTLVRAFETLKSTGEYTGRLEIVGKVGWKSDETMRAIATSSFREDIRHRDYLSREELAQAYRGADVFVMPSIYEGFGFPILEAMSHGVPVIAANNSSMPEVGGDAAKYFATGNASELAEVIRRITSDESLRAGMIDRGFDRAGSFPWKRTAEETLAVFRRVAGISG